jgi:hypothetical protein
MAQIEKEAEAEMHKVDEAEDESTTVVEEDMNTVVDTADESDPFVQPSISAGTGRTGSAVPAQKKRSILARGWNGLKNAPANVFRGVLKGTKYTRKMLWKILVTIWYLKGAIILTAISWCYGFLDGVLPGEMFDYAVAGEGAIKAAGYTYGMASPWRLQVLAQMAPGVGVNVAGQLIESWATPVKFANSLLNGMTGGAGTAAVNGFVANWIRDMAKVGPHTIFHGMCNAVHSNLGAIGFSTPNLFVATMLGGLVFEQRMNLNALFTMWAPKWLRGETAGEQALREGADARHELEDQIKHEHEEIDGLTKKLKEIQEKHNEEMQAQKDMVSTLVAEVKESRVKDAAAQLRKGLSAGYDDFKKRAHTIKRTFSQQFSAGGEAQVSGSDSDASEDNAGDPFSDKRPISEESNPQNPSDASEADW